MKDTPRSMRVGPIAIKSCARCGEDHDVHFWPLLNPSEFTHHGVCSRTGEPILMTVREAPTIVCLCGSTRFMEAFQEANLRRTLAGYIVLSVGCDTKSDSELKITDEQKHALDELHKRKIDLADEILVLNVGGYIGESTRSEIEYAKSKGKKVFYLEHHAEL